MSSKTEEQLIDIIANHFGVPQADVTPDKSLVEDLNADSLEMTELMVELEKRFGCEISETEASSLRTVGEVLQFVKKLEAKKESTS